MAGSDPNGYVENSVGKGEIARYEQFFLFPQCFQGTFFPGASKGVIVWEWVKQSRPSNSVCKVQDLRKGGRWFDPQHGQYSFQGLMIVIATVFIPLSQLSIVSTMVVWESSRWLGKNIALRVQVNTEYTKLMEALREWENIQNVPFQQYFLRL